MTPDKIKLCFLVRSDSAVVSVSLGRVLKFKTMGSEHFGKTSLPLKPKVPSDRRSQRFQSQSTALVIPRF
ncbi:hypothetical protein PoB_004977500 [Plakobranchus ocellatus]|uniref:Uncharacterized protein n=1 Tax=Plakobranchus ocellatus TaxID=259542 RepID=A0AAV4BVC0_9GAST|nr:hypothetical protein PoB_004977500 [Plakobranchus ocellatus]